MVVRLVKSVVIVASLLAAMTATGNVSPGVKAFERGHPSSALRSWLPLAREGNPKAQNNVGLMYERGLGVSQSYPEAMRWYRLAADQGLPEANHNLGLLYYSGYGTDVNDREALNAEYLQLKDEVSRIAKDAKYNGVQIASREQIMTYDQDLETFVLSQSNGDEKYPLPVNRTSHAFEISSCFNAHRILKKTIAATVRVPSTNNQGLSLNPVVMYAITTEKPSTNMNGCKPVPLNIKSN